MENVVDINTRRPTSFKSSTLDMANQLVAMEGVLEIVRVLECISCDFHDTSPVFQREASTISEEFRSEMSDILRDTAEKVERLEDRWFGPPNLNTPAGIIASVESE